MQPGGQPPIYMESVVGYAQWYMQRGVSALEVEQRIAANPDYGGLPEEIVLASIARAQQNIHATELLRTGTEATTVGYAFSGELEPGDRVGVRVIIQLNHPILGPTEASVVINASVYSTAGQILAAAEQWVTSGGLAALGQESGQGTFETAYIGALYQGAMQNAAISLP